MSASTDIEIRQAIASIINSSLISLYGSDMKVRVHDHWMLAQALGEDAGALRVLEGAEAGKIHAWMIGLSGVGRTRPDVSQNEMGNARLKTVGPKRRDTLRSYRVWCYHYIDSGTSGSESTTNSDSILSTEIEKVADAFSLNPTLGISNPFIQGHKELQFAPIDTFAFGKGGLANIAQGTLEVVVYRDLT